MTEWLSANLGTIVVGAILVVIVALALRRIIKHKTTCGCGCSDCAMKNACHKAPDKKNGSR